MSGTECGASVAWPFSVPPWPQPPKRTRIGPSPAVDAGPSTQGQCLECHQARDSALVDAWRAGPHGRSGRLRRLPRQGHGALPAARRDEACTGCHAGPATHSYATSKHGVLVRIGRPDWSRPLRRGEHRSPGCAYCHLHQGNHDVGAGVRAWNPVDGTDAAEQERVQEVMRAVCQDCHAPRYITRLFDNGERMLEIGQMKVREAAGLLEPAAGEYTEEELAAARDHFERMQERHLHNLYLGIAHQSPDYQWWHGQPALDGDLLRIRGALDELDRSHVGGDDRGRTEP